MSDWNPALYLRFEAERSRPAAELVNRIAHLTPLHITDLGCGPGNSTELLRNAWPQAVITGLDNSPAMLDKAREHLPGCAFAEADIATWEPAVPQDLIFSNAALQWLPDHRQLLPRLAGFLDEDGVLAVQMPDNWEEPSHRLMRQVAGEQGLPPAAREALLDAQGYYDCLVGAGCSVDIWRTTYLHVLPSVQAIIDWLRATGLRPYLGPLDTAGQERFLERYRGLLAEHYPQCRDGNVLLAFPRLFIVARRVGE